MQLRRVVSEPRPLGVVELLGVGIFPVVAPAGVDVEHVARLQAALAQALRLQHRLDVLRGDQRARLHRLALAEMGFGVEQHRGGDDRRHLVDAELLQRRVRRGLDLLLREAAVIFRAGRTETRPCRPMPAAARRNARARPSACPAAPGSPLSVSSLLKACRVPGMPTVGLVLVAQRRARTATAAWCWSADATARRTSPSDWRDAARSASRSRGRACWPCRSRRRRARATRLAHGLRAKRAAERMKREARGRKSGPSGPPWDFSDTGTLCRKAIIAAHAAMPGRDQFFAAQYVTAVTVAAAGPGCNTALMERG